VEFAWDEDDRLEETVEQPAMREIARAGAMRPAMLNSFDP
jgi:hypothetical protein